MSHTGFEQSTAGIWIAKDPQAVLTYTFDWSEWLKATDIITNVVYTIQTRVNDPAPLVTQGSTFNDTKTYITLSAGQLGKTYLVTAKITTQGGLIDRRNFRVQVENRSA